MIPYFHLEPIGIQGVLAIQPAGILLIVGVAAGWLACEAAARKRHIPVAVVRDFMPRLLLGLLVGSRVGELLFYRPAELFAGLQGIRAVLQGESSLGALLGALGMGYFYVLHLRRKALPLFQSREGVMSFIDVMLYGVTFGWFFGRLGCFVVHDHPGTVTTFWLGVQGICVSAPSAAACHDLGLYEAGLALAIFLALTAFSWGAWSSGHVTIFIALAYASVRLLLDFLRDPSTDARYLGWTPAQYACLLTVLFCVRWLWRRARPH